MRDADDDIAWIDWRPEQKDAQRLAQLFDALEAPGGKGLDHVLKIHGPMPETLASHLAFYRSVMREPGPLSRVEREIVGVVVSDRNQCHY
jgi:alkylhydroperoxidase family enzyme